MAGRTKKYAEPGRLDPKNDFIFRKLFSSPGNEDLLTDLLNSILQPTPEKTICQVNILNPIKPRDHRADKEAVMDILARTNDGTLVTIEIQVADEHNMAQRAVYYWSVVFTSQMVTGMTYAEIKKTISINILDYVFLKQTARYHTVFHLCEETEGFQLTDVEEIRFVDLPKMLDKWRKSELIRETEPLTKWFLLLEANEDQEIAKELEAMAMSDAALQKAIREWERLSRDPETIAQYISRMKGKMDRLSALKTAEERGMAKGRAEGMAEGRAEGRAEAKQEAICTLLDKRFQPVAGELQEKVRQMTAEKVLDRIYEELLEAETVEQAKQIISRAGKTKPR